MAQTIGKALMAVGVVFLFFVVLNLFSSCTLKPNPDYRNCYDILTEISWEGLFAFIFLIIGGFVYVGRAVIHGPQPPATPSSSFIPSPGFCPRCRQPRPRNAVTCPYCGSPYA